MIFIKIILFLHLIRGSLSDVSSSAENVLSKNFLNSSKLLKNSTLDGKKKSPGFRFRLPFMDMQLQNQRNIHIMQERLQKQQVYVLHGNEMYQMFVGREEKRLALVGYLGGSVRDYEPLGAEIIDLREYLIMVIALEEYLEVYQLSVRFLESRAQATKDPKLSNETAPIFEPVQQISLLGRYRQHFLTDPTTEHIMLIVGINFTKLYGRLQTFIWANSYFEPIEELTVPPLHTLHILGTYPKYLIRGRAIKHQAKTIITVAEIQSTTMTLHTTQTLTVNSHTLHFSKFHGRQYLIACSTKQKQCNSFRMSTDGSGGSSGGGLFSVYKQRSSKDLAFDKFIGGEHFLVAARQNQIMVFTSGRLDCYASFKTNESDVTSLMTLVNAHGENFILVTYKRPLHTLIRMVELESETGGLLGAAALNASDLEDSTPINRHRHMFEETIGALRSLLLRRRNAMTTFHKASLLANNLTRSMELNLPHPVHIHGGEINKVKLVDSNLQSPVQLLQRVAKMRQQFANARFRRDLTERESLSRLNVKNLQVKNLVYDNNVLADFYLDKDAKPLPILSVRPKLTTNKLTTQKLSTHHKIRHARADFTFNNSTASLSKLKQLNVNNINGVAWQDFYESLFLKNRNRPIKGRLILQATANVTNLSTTFLNGLAVESLLNLRQPQVVKSNILFSGFLIKNLSAASVNGLDFANDIVFQNTDSLIETPVNMHQLSISKDLLFSDNVTIQRTPSDDDVEETEFKQHYTGKVIINGTLTIRNLTAEQKERTKILLDKKLFSTERIKQKFLLLNEPQHFKSTIVFGNAKVTLPKLKTKFLNNQPIESHLLVNQKPTTQQPLLLIFLQAQLEGDLTMVNGSTRLANISRNAVRRHEVANITGTKTFGAPLTIDDVMTLTLNEMPVSELVLKSQLTHSFRFKQLKSFKNLDVEKVLLVEKTLNTTNLNNLPMEQFFNADFRFKRLQLPYMLEAKNVIFHNINGINFDEVFENFNIRDGELLLHKKLIVEGNLKFHQNLNVTSINGIDWQSYQNDLVRVNENAEIDGKKCFQEELTITNELKVETINDLKLEQIFKRVLSKSKPQAISGYYSFGNVKFSNLDTPIINDMATTEFIDMRDENIILEGDVIMPQITVHGDIVATDSIFGNELQNFTERINQLTTQKWQNMVIVGNAYWPVGETAQHELLHYIYRNAVQREGQQIISGNVKLTRPLITIMHTKKDFPKNFDLDFFAKDCILRHAEDIQIIAAAKEFVLPVQMHKVAITASLDTHLLNGIELLRFNASLYRPTSKMPIYGPLMFRVPPTFVNLTVEQFINGINPAMIYHNITATVPPIYIGKLLVAHSLQIETINGESLDYLLENRLTKKDVLPQQITGHLVFENLILSDNNIVQSINDVPVSDLVFKKSKQLQAITGSKTFESGLQLQGPAHVLWLNDKDLSESFEHTIFKNVDYKHDKLAAQSATFEQGLIVRPTSQAIEPILGTSLSRNSTQEIKTAIQTSVESLTRVLLTKKSKSKNLLYLDYASNWQISCGKANVSVSQSYRLSSKRTSFCERQFQQVDISHPANSSSYGQLFLSNFTTNFITADAHNISVKAENYCQPKYRKVKSKITITTAVETRVIGLKKYIENIFVYKPFNSSDIFILLHAIDWAHNQHEVRILILPKLSHNNITDWQSLTVGIGKNVRLFDFENYTALISGGAILENRPSLSIYNFNAITSQFELFQNITGDFDVFELLLPTTTLHSREFQLILSCSQCRQVHIYNYKPQMNSSSYEIFQLVKLKSLIDRIQTFSLEDGSLFMLLLGEHGQQYFYLYRFTQLQGWLQKSYGYFEHIEMIIPLSNGQLEMSEHNLLTLICGSNQCKLIKAIVV